MRRRNLKPALILVLFTIFIFAYQNCGNVSLSRRAEQPSIKVATATPTPTPSATPTPPPSTTPTADSLDAGDTHTCAKLSNGAVKCWGSNDSGQLGNGNTTLSLVPIPVLGIAAAVEISAGSGHTCTRLGTPGPVKCWGSGDRGQLGDGNSSSSLTPVLVGGGLVAVEVSAASAHTCARLQNGSVMCWGNNTSGQLGNGNQINSPTPVLVNGNLTAVEISARNAHTCARLGTPGQVKCWGWNAYGQLGNGNENSSPVPVLVGGGLTAVEISNGYYHSCARLQNGTVKCWGNNEASQLGNGNQINSSTPVLVGGGSLTAVKIAASENHTCAIVPNGDVKCWGHNGFLQLGNNTMQSSSTPVLVQGIHDVVEITAGMGHTCARLQNGEVKCWGDNGWAQLGNNSTTSSHTPVTVQWSGP